MHGCVKLPWPLPFSSFGFIQKTWGNHLMLFQCWASIEDGGPTLKQHWVNSPCLLGRHLPGWSRNQKFIAWKPPWMMTFPASMRHWPNIGLLLGQSHRRWANSKPMLGKHIMLAGLSQLKFCNLGL